MTDPAKTIPQEATEAQLREAVVRAYGALAYMQAYPDERNVERTVAQLLKILTPVVPAHVVEAAKTMAEDFR